MATVSSEIDSPACCAKIVGGSLRISPEVCRRQSTSSNDALVSGLIELILLTPVSMICGGGSSRLSIWPSALSTLLKLSARVS